MSTTLPLTVATSLIPLREHLIAVKLREGDRKTPGGILIPATAREEHQRGKAQVLAVGKGRALENVALQDRPTEAERGGRAKDIEPPELPPEFKVGDIIIYNKFSATEIRDADQDVLVIRFGDVAAKVRQ